MYIAANFNFVEQNAVIQGDTFERRFEFTNFDVEGKSFKMQVRRQYQVAPVLEFTSDDDSITIVDSVVVLRKSAEDMAITPNLYVYDLQATEGETITTIMRGTMQILESYTD